MATNKHTKIGFWHGFFLALGFGKIPASDETINIIETGSREKINSDLRKIKEDYRSSFDRISRDLVIQ